MELVNARRSRTVLTAASEGDIIAAVGRVTLRSCELTQELELSDLRLLEALPGSHFHQHKHLCFHTRGCVRTPFIRV